MTLELPGGVLSEIRIRGENTDGNFTMLTDKCPPGWQLPPHRHSRESETILVTSGRTWMKVGEESGEYGAGDTIHVPIGVKHEGGTLGDEPLERAIIFSPSGMEKFFEAMAAEDDPAKMFQLTVDYGWDFS